MPIPVRVRQARHLVPPDLRTIRWSTFVVLVGVGCGLVWSGFHHGGDPRQLQLPMAGVLLAIWVGFLVDDPAAESVASVPFSLVDRRGVRLLAPALAVTSAWILFCVQARVADMWIALSVAFVAQILVAIGSAATGIRALGPSRGGPVAAGCLALVFVILPLLFKVPLTLDPRTDSWNHLYGRPLWIGAVGLVAFFLASSDPARRGPIPRLRRPRRQAIATGTA